MGGTKMNATPRQPMPNDTAAAPPEGGLPATYGSWASCAMKPAITVSHSAIHPTAMKPVMCHGSLRIRPMIALSGRIISGCSQCANVLSHFGEIIVQLMVAAREPPYPRLRKHAGIQLHVRNRHDVVILAVI